MWMISLRDLQWRRRRFVIAVAATGLAFSLTLVMSGVMHSMHNESERTVALYDADEWVVAGGATGPFTTTQFLPAGAADEVRALAGVESASPLLVARATIDRKDVNIVGYELGGPTQPDRLEDGAFATARGQAIVDEALGPDVGETVSFGGRTYPIVGTTSKTTFYFGMPTVFLPIEDVQEALFAGQDVASAIVVDGEVGTPPPGTDVLTSEQVRDDLDRVLEATGDTLDIVNTLLRLMACGIVAAMVYISVLERLRDFAVLKATGATNRALVGGVVLQACVLAVVSAVVSIGLAALIAPTFAFTVEIPTSAYVQLLVIALVVGALASFAGLRRVTRIDPALSFGGA